MTGFTPMNLQLSQALRWLSQAQLHGAGDVQVLRVHTDSRSLQPGDLFVALRGERFDGHQFIAQAQSLGAVAVLCEASGAAAAQAAGLAALVVPDARIALGELALSFLLLMVLGLWLTRHLTDLTRASRASTLSIGSSASPFQRPAITCSACSGIRWCSPGPRRTASRSRSNPG